MSIFDTYKNGMFNVTTKVMGYGAVWVNSETLEEFTAKVHFRHATPAEDLSMVDYHPEHPYMEFKAGDFDGLKALVDAGSAELISIEGKGNFYVRDAIGKYDGDTFACALAPATETPIP